jgi:hypothetical protein
VFERNDRNWLVSLLRSRRSTVVRDSVYFGAGYVFAVNNNVHGLGFGVGDPRRWGIQLAALAARQLLRTFLFTLLLFLTLLKCG